MNVRALACATMLTVLCVPVRAQSMREACAQTAPDDTVCRNLVDAALSLPARTSIVATGGNVSPGTASTLGMRIPGSPRWSVALRGNAAGATLPRADGNGAITPTFWSIHADVGVGVFNGMTLMPTVGGFGAIDLLASAGLLVVPESDGFDRSSPVTWAAGARVGILRESFTAPGISVSGMYRSIPDISYRTEYSNRDQSVVSVRGTIGKRVVGIGLTGGLGYDRIGNDVRVTFTGAGTGTPPSYIVDARDSTFSRVSYFGNASYTWLVLNVAAELGWQHGEDTPAGAHDDAGKGGVFGGLSIRLAL